MYAFEDAIFERLLDALKIGDRVVVTSHLFYEFKTNSERVALAYQLLEEENLLPTCNYACGKSREVAADLRNEGNKSFQKKKDIDALQFYNKSLAAAPFKSKEYALAIANRSAVNWSLGFFEACVCDIELAFQNGYPNELRMKLLERRAKCFLRLGNRTDAEKALEALQNEWKQTPLGKRILSEACIKLLVKDYDCLQNIPEESELNKQTSVSLFGCSSRPAVSYDLNPEIECASSCVALKFSEDKGRYLVATKNINPGDVLIVEPPFASVLLPDAAFTHCYNCLKYCASPLPCSHCAEVMFCDEKCRSECWERFHSVDCPLLPTISKSVGKMGLLALRVLLVASCKGTEVKRLFNEVEEVQASEDARMTGFNKDGRYISTDYLPIHFLIGHSDRRANADLFRRSVTAACLLHCLENLTCFFGTDVDDELYYFCGGLLLHHLQSLPCNAHEVSEMIVNRGTFESQEIGAAGYATLSLLNHSCDPNVVRHSYQDWAVLRAIRPIREGAEIVDNYGYHHALHSVDQRRSQLSKQYFFYCLCEACQDCWPLYKDQPTTNPTFKCSGCGAALRKEQYSEGHVSCTCGAFCDIDEMESNIKRSSKSFRETLLNVLAGCQKEEVLQSLLQHLILLENSVQRPWREFSECQETIKQCISLQANHVIFSLQNHCQ